MYAELYSYLILNKSLPVPGIGTFLLQRHPAVADFPNKSIVAPYYEIILANNKMTPSVIFFKWLSQHLSLSNHEAVTKFNDFAFDLKQQVIAGATINWSDIGTISKGLDGGIKFISQGKIILEEPVFADKIIREKSEHFVRVGEEEKTSQEMTVLLNKEEEKKSNWWVLPLVIGILSIIFLGWFFSENGVAISSTANSKKLIPIDSSSTYKIIP